MIRCACIREKKRKKILHEFWEAVKPFCIHAWQTECWMQRPDLGDREQLLVLNPSDQCWSKLLDPDNNITPQSLKEKNILEKKTILKKRTEIHKQQTSCLLSSILSCHPHSCKCSPSFQKKKDSWATIIHLFPGPSRWRGGSWATIYVKMKRSSSQYIILNAMSYAITSLPSWFGD